MNRPTSTFRLAVWKPASPVRQLAAYSGPEPHLECDFHEEVYSWDPSEDIWSSLKDGTQTEKARSALVEAFDPNKPPEERSIKELEKALVVLKEILDTPEATGWSECTESVKAGMSDELNLRANTILTLYSHLQWVWDVFKYVPGASVTVR